MSKVVSNAHAYGDINQIVATAPLGTTAPTAPPPAALPSGWSDLGWMSDNGITETLAQQETKVYGWQGGSLIRDLRSQSEHSFAFECLEENAATLGLLRPGSAVATTGGTAEVQTVTISGTPTGGTFTLTVPGYGSTAPLAYNVSTAALATALSTLVGQTVTVAGTAGTTYTVTFPAAMGNVAQMVADGSLLTPASAAVAVATTTPGVNGTNRTGVRPFVSQNLRQFSIDLIDGAIHHRYHIPNGEVVSGGNIVYQANALTIYSFTCNCYIDTSGNFFYDISDNPATAQGLFV